MCEDARIISKIKKLLALADLSKNNSDAEALAALSKAQQLMAQNGIQMSDMDEVESSEVISMECEHKWNAGYRQPLASIIARNYRCKCFLSNGTVVFYGLREDAIIAKEAFEFCYRWIMRRGNQLYEKYRREHYSGKGVFNSYAVGFLRGLKEVLDAQSRALMIVVPKEVESRFLSDINASVHARGGINTSAAGGVYSSIVKIGVDEAKDKFSNKALCYSYGS